MLICTYLSDQKAILPSSQSIVVVLLKLLLATVTGNPAANANAHQHPGSPGADVPGECGSRRVKETH